MSRRTSSAALANETTTLSVRLDVKVKRRLDRLAKASDRTASWLAQDAIAGYLDLQEWQVQAIREAVRNADAHPDRVVAHEQVKEWAKSWGSRKEIARPR